MPETEKPIVLSDVNEIGVYYKDRSGRWTAIDPEIVHIKSGGFIKSTVTNGIIKQDRNGRVNGRESALALKRPIEVLLYTPEGVAATEYTFVRFRLNSSNREFRILTGGVFHSSGGADRDEVPFKAGANRSAHLRVHRRRGRPWRRVRHPPSGHGKRHQRRKDLHLCHRRIELRGTLKHMLKRPSLR